MPGRCLPKIILFATRQRAVARDCGHIGIETHRPIKVSSSPLKIALATERVASINECAREVWIDPERLSEVGNGPFVALLLVPHQTALVIGAGIREPQSDGVIKI